MPVKISKVAKDLNVGTQTIIEFLSKKNITVESNPNARISDEHYRMLLDAFRTDKDQRIKSDNFSSERRQERTKPEKQKQQRKGEDFISTASQIPTPKVVGKIDLSQDGKPKVEPVQPSVTEEKPQEEVKTVEINQSQQQVEADDDATPEPIVSKQHEVVEEVAADQNTAMDNGNNDTTVPEKNACF